MNQFIRRVAAGAMLLGAIALAVYAMKWILLLVAGALLAIIFRTAAEWLCAHSRLSLRWAIAIILIAVVVLVLGTTWEFGSKLAAQADQLTSRLSQALASLQHSAQRYPNLHRLLSPSKINLQRPTEGLVLGVLWAIAAVVAALFIGAYGCIDPGLYIRGFLKFFPERRRPAVKAILKDVGAALKAWIAGQLIAMAVVGTIATIGLLVLGVPMAVPLAVVAGLFTFVPYIGAIASAVPALLLGFSVSTQTALYVAIVFLIAHVAEGYIIVPIVQHRLVYLPPALIIANLVLMEVVIGITGVALGTPVLVIAMVLVDHLYFHESWAGEQKAA